MRSVRRPTLHLLLRRRRLRVMMDRYFLYKAGDPERPIAEIATAWRKECALSLGDDECDCLAPVPHASLMRTPGGICLWLSRSQRRMLAEALCAEFADLSLGVRTAAVGVSSDPPVLHS